MLNTDKNVTQKLDILAYAWSLNIQEAEAGESVGRSGCWTK